MVYFNLLKSYEGDSLKWKVELTSAAQKQRKKLPQKIQAQFDLLAKEIEVLGPIRKTWKNFSAFHKNRSTPSNVFHCHIKKGHPTYVACWKVIDKTRRIIEVYYVGTHEKAPY